MTLSPRQASGCRGRVALPLTYCVQIPGYGGGRLSTLPGVTRTENGHYLVCSMTACRCRRWNVGSLRGPLHIELHGGVVGEPGLPASIGLHHVDFPVPVPVRNEGYSGGVSGPRRALVQGRVIGQTSLTGAIGVHHIDFIVPLPVGLEGYSGALRGPTP